MSKKEIVTDYTGAMQKFNCVACAREKGEFSLGNIVKSKHFDAHQDYAVPIPGFVIVSSRRHIQSIDEFTDSEQKDFIKFLFQLRQSMRKALKIKNIYLFQAEDTSHRHFHVWLLPRYNWMNKFGKSIESIRPIINYAKNNFTAKKDVFEIEKAIQKLKELLS